MSERRRGAGAVLAAGVLLLAACSRATPGPEPGPTRAPDATSPEPSPGDQPVPETSPDHDPAAPHGEVQGVSWTLVHDDRGERLEIRRDQEHSTVEITRDEQGCYISDAVEGRWCELPKLAETLILFHPNVVKPVVP